MFWAQQGFSPEEFEGVFLEWVGLSPVLYVKLTPLRVVSTKISSGREEKSTNDRIGEVRRHRESVWGVQFLHQQDCSAE